MREVWIGVFCVTLSFLLSFGLALQNSRTAVARYVGVWEEEIAKQLLFEKSAQTSARNLDLKIRSQLQDIAPDARAAAVSETCGLEFLRQDVPVTLYGTPAGSLSVCRSPAKLVKASVTAPFFSLGLLLSTLISFVLFIRRRRAEWRDQQLQSELRLSKEVAMLARQIAHDIRSPLSALNAVVQSDGDIRETRPLLEAASKRISGIADSLLERGNKSEMQSTDARISLPALVKEFELQSPNIAFELDLSNYNTTIPVSPLDFERAISNLVTNSVEATADAPHPIIRISAKRSTPYIRVTIEDNGQGIPDSILKRLGKEIVTFGKRNGNGLGVLGAKRLVEKTRGRFQIESIPGSTCVTLDFLTP